MDQLILRSSVDKCFFQANTFFPFFPLFKFKFVCFEINKKMALQYSLYRCYRRSMKAPPRWGGTYRDESREKRFYQSNGTRHGGLSPRQIRRTSRPNHRNSRMIFFQDFKGIMASKSLSIHLIFPVFSAVC